MCVSIHLECWLNKARVEIVPWAVVDVACQLQFSYNSVIKSDGVDATDLDSIRILCASSECEFKDLPPSIHCVLFFGKK